VAFAKLSNVRIAAVAAAVPAQTESNLSLPFGDEVNQKLISTTGIETRHIAPEGMCASDLCFAAAEKLLNDNHIDRSTVKLMIFNSQTPDFRIPHTSGHLQHRLALGTDTICFDMTMGCSGYLYALFTAGSILETVGFNGQNAHCDSNQHPSEDSSRTDSSSGDSTISDSTPADSIIADSSPEKTGVKRALVLAGDVLSPSVSKYDRSARPLFGDAGSATLLEFEEGNTSFWGLNTDGSGFETLMIEAGGARKPISPGSFEYKEFSKDIKRREFDLSISGMDIFNFSISLVPKIIKEFFAHFAIDPGKIDLWLLHQANMMINGILAKKLAIPEGKMPLSLKEFGNTSAVSIPLTMVTKAADTLRNGEISALMSGFGTGLSLAVNCLKLKNVKVSELCVVG